MEYSVQFENLVKKFGTSTILDDVTFKIHDGSITTILGFSGAGKTTLMKHILGLTKPTTGDVVVLGTNIGKLSDWDLREFRKNFGMVFQYAALISADDANQITKDRCLDYPLGHHAEFHEITNFLCINNFVNLQ